nr:GYF domain containing protein [Haemonchus contortus]
MKRLTIARRVLKTDIPSVSDMRLFSYLDDHGCLRGPFCEVQMHYWYLQKYLPPSLLVIVHGDGMGRQNTLGQLVTRNGDANPFDDATIHAYDCEKHLSMEEKEFLSQIMEAFESYTGGTLYKRKTTNSVIAGCDMVAPGYFSYIDRHSCLRNFVEQRGKSARGNRRDVAKSSSKQACTEADRAMIRNA